MELRSIFRESFKPARPLLRAVVAPGLTLHSLIPQRYTGHYHT
jgi:hypothetical protein